MTKPQIHFLRHVLLAVFIAVGFCGYAQTPVLKDKKFGTHKIGDREYKTYKAFIDVPENRNDSSPRIIRLPVFVIQSPNTKPAEPVFYFRGGPGASNIVTTDNALLLENHDFVCVGYRGADGPVFKSKKVGKSMRGKNHQLLSDESIDHASEAMADYFKKLEKEGYDFSCYSIMDVIEDVEYARKAMGYTQINALSGSYGTRVALIYSYKYPDIIKRSAMVGANPPGNFKWDPLELDHIIDRYDSVYKAQNNPNYRGSIKQAMKTAFEKMPKRWRGLKLDADKIKIGTFMLMFQVNGAVMGFDAYFKAANENDYSGLYSLQLLYDLFVPKSIWGDMALKGYTADFRPDTNYREKYRAYNDLVLGPNYSLLLWGLKMPFTVETIPEEYRKPRISETPTMIISGNLDVSTPAVNTFTELMPYLPNGQHIHLKNMSHQDFSAQRESYNKCIAGFFDTGVADGSLFKQNEIDFKPKKNLGKIMKRFYPVILITQIFM